MKTKFVKVIVPVVAALFIAALAYVGYSLGTTSRAIIRDDIVVKVPLDEVSSNNNGGEVTVGKSDVAWVTPERISPLNLFKVATSSDEYFFDVEKTALYYFLGTIQSGQYKGASIVRVDVSLEGGPGFPAVLYFIKNGTNPLVLLSRGEKDKYIFAYFKDGVVASSTFPIYSFSDFISPKTLTYNGATFTLDGVSDDIDQRLFEEVKEYSTFKVAFSDPSLGEVYTDDVSTSTKQFPRNGFYVKTNYGALRAYRLDIPFFDNTTRSYNITWKGSAMMEGVVDYDSTDVGGCGSHNYISVVHGVDKSELMEAGKASNGDLIYVLRDEKHSLLTQMFETFNGFYSYSGKSLAYQDFLNKRPLFFWYDPFGRLIKFQRADFMPAVECGKPVIYLYPEATTTVSVELSPVGGFSKTEPTYDDGWNVIATPQGDLTEIKTGKAYPYLFWEGRGGIYETPEKGFAVKRENIHSFLVEKLTKLGLNKKERDDFIEFWEPRMKSAPYYFVTFMTNSTMDKLAPMTVTPAPTTVIRILMDFTPLEKRIATQEYEIVTPKRNGFTVVEWGGVMR